MKKYFALTIALLAWFAVIAQYILMIEHTIASIPETTIRFFSFFTILTNALVAVYMTQLFIQWSSKTKSLFASTKLLTPLTVYITIVGLVYQVALRHIWNPQGIDRVVDELLHTLIPSLMIVYWFLDENKKNSSYKNIPKWLIYPICYLIYILIRGYFSAFYPYPFVNVSQIGLQQACINAAFLILFFIIMSSVFIFLEKRIRR
jgi:hypothetical protein